MPSHKEKIAHLYHGNKKIRFALFPNGNKVRVESKRVDDMNELCKFIKKTNRNIFFMKLGEFEGLTVTRTFIENVGGINSGYENERLMDFVKSAKSGPYFDPILT